MSTVNATMREVGDGEVGRFWAEQTDRYERMVVGVYLDGAAWLAHAAA